MGPEKSVLASLAALLVSISGNAWYILEDLKPANPPAPAAPVSCHCADGTSWAPLFAVSSVSLLAGILVGLFCCATAYYWWSPRCENYIWVPRCVQCSPSPSRVIAPVPSRVTAPALAASPPPPLRVVDGASL